MNIISKLNEICNDKTKKRLKFEDGTITCDTYSASAILNVYNFIGDKNKAVIEEKIKTKEGFISIVNICFAILSKASKL